MNEDVRKPNAADRNALPEISGLYFNVSRLSSVNCIWLARTWASADPTVPAELEARIAYFIQKFAYAIPSGKGLEELTFDNTDVLTYWAERYGGNGLSGNGGGVRVGNYDGYQIKGIGQNPLVGQVAEFMHRYGGLTAAEATYEAIYAHIVDCVLPVGAVRIHGVLGTGPRAALLRYNSEEPDAEAEQWRCWGALMVRDQCRRPSHFLRTQTYVPAAPETIRIAPDVARVRAVNKALLAEHGDVNGYMMYLGGFLQNCANQFALARIAGIAHGTLSPSNIAMDGRWIDLARTTFVTRGENNGYFLPFEEERRAPLMIIKELTDTFAKYNAVMPNVSLLNDYYRRQYVAYFDLHLSYLFGIDCKDLSEEVLATSYAALIEQVKVLFQSTAQRTINPFAGHRTTDPVTTMIESLFRGLANRPADMGPAQAMPGGFDRHLAVAALRELFQSIHAAQDMFRFRSITLRSAALALKRALIPEFFFKKRLDDLIRAVPKDRPERYGEILQTFVAVADWGLTDDANDSLVLFQFNGIAIRYDAADACYRLNGALQEIFLTADALDAALNKIPAASFVIEGFDFRPYIIRVLSIMRDLETDHV